MCTVIYSDMGDTDTKVLKNIWDGMDSVKLIRITTATKNSREIVDKALREETDTLIMCGHGSPHGLFNPNWNLGYLVDRNNSSLIKAKRVIGIWCYARAFAESVKLKGFYSSMFISNSNEAKVNNIYSVSDKEITEQEILFCERLNSLIKEDCPMNTWIDLLRSKADYNNPVVKFNYNGLCFY